MRSTLNEAQAERLCDRRVQNALRHDRAYQNAASADEQAQAEQAVERRVVAGMLQEFDIPSWGEVHA